MSLNLLSLSGVEFIENPTDVQYVTLRTGPGDNDWANVLLSDFRTFITAQVNTRIDNLSSEGGGGPGPSIWPAARTMTLAGVVTGSVAFDGSADFTLNTSLADGALTIAKTAGLQSALDALVPKANPTFTGVMTLAGDMLPDADNVRSLGSPALMWKDVYIGPGSLYINGQKVLEDNSGTIRMLADPNQNIAIQTSGSGDIELAPTGTGVIQMKGTLTLLGGSKIRSSNGTALLFDDSISFEPGNGFVGPVTIDGNAILTTASFDPADYAPLGGSANFSTLTVNGNTVYHSGNLDLSAGGYLTTAATLFGPGYNADADSFAPGTKRLVHNTNFNIPGTNSTYWYIETLQTGTDATTLLQRAWATTSDETYTRRCNAGAWSAWRRVWNSASFDPNSKLDSNAVAASATKLQTARTFSIAGGGPITANGVAFDGTGNVTLTANIADNALTIAMVSGLTTQLAGRIATGTAFYDAFSASAITAAGSSDANTFGLGTRYIANPDVGVLNLPYSGPGYVETLRGDANFTMQRAIDNAGVSWVRAKYGTTWDAWRKLHDSVSLNTATFNAASATKLQTARSIALTGTVTGSANFDGSAGISINTAIADGALTIAKVAGLQAALDEGGSGGGGGVLWTVISAANVNPAVSKTGYLMRCAGGLYTVTLPAGAEVGFEVTVKAIGGQVRIVTNGNTINSLNPGDDLLLNDGDACTLVASAAGELGLIWANNSLAAAPELPAGAAYSLVGEAIATQATTSLVINNLDVISDGQYFVVYGLKNALGGYVGVECFFNDDTTTSNYYTNYVASQTSSARQNNAEAVGLDANATSTGICWLQRDVDGYARLTNTISRGYPSQVNSMFIALARNVPGQNVNKMEFRAKTANAIAPGSYIKVYKMAVIGQIGTNNLITGRPYMGPKWSQVSSLLHVNGANGSTTITDEIAGNVWTALNATISNAVSMVDGQVLNFTGASNSSISMPTNSKFDVGSGEWAFECRIWPKGAHQQNARIFQTRDGDNYGAISLNFTNGQQLGLQLSANGGGFAFNATNVGTLVEGQMNTLIVQRAGNFIEVFINGRRTYIEGVAASLSLYYNAADKIIIGGNATGTSRSINAYMDEIRFSKKAVIGAEITLPSTPFVNGDQTETAPSGNGYTTGTSFPLGPYDGQRFYRTDRNIEYFYKAPIEKWLSVQEYDSQICAPNTSALWTSSTGANVGVRQEDIYLTDINLGARVTGTNNGTAYWTYDFNYVDLVGGTTVVLASYSTQGLSFVSPSITHQVFPVNQVVRTSALGVNATKVSSAGAAYSLIRFNYRLIG